MFVLSSRQEDSHLRALPDPYVNLSIHTAPDVRPFPWHSCQWAKSVGFTRRSRSNQSRAPLVSLGIGATGSHVRYKSLVVLRAAYMPDAARAGFRVLPS